MPSIPSISPQNVSGLADKVVGVGKEILGTVTGREGIKKSGQLQQEAGAEKLQAIEKELEANAKEGKAKSAEQAQQSAKKSKESSNA
jgi:hypothetical protein